MMKQQMKTYRRAWESLGQALLFFSLLFGSVSMAGATDKQYCVNVNYSSVPTQLNYKKITLMVNVGTCASAAVTADGASVPATYISSSGTALFTTTGSSIIVTAVNWTAGGTGAATKATLYNNYHWAYSLTFDDNRQSQYDYGVTLLQQHGWRAAEAVVSTWANTGGPGQYFMNWTELQTLRNTYGWDMMNHSNDHPNPLTCNGSATDIVPEVTQNQTTLLTKFPGYYVNQMVFPYENSTANTCSGYPTSFLLSAECGGGSFNYVDVTLPFQFQRGGLFGTDDTAWKSLADSAATNSRPTWLVEYTHSVSSGSSAAADQYSTNQATLGDLLNHLDTTYGATGNKSLWFAPAPEVRDYIFVRDNAMVTTCTVATPTPTMTNAATSTPTATFTFTRTSTPTNTSTFTSTGTASFTPTSTASFTRTNTNSFTPTNSFTFTPTNTSTNSPTRTFTSTNTVTQTNTNTVTNTRTVTPTNTLTATPSSTPTDTATVTLTGTASPTATYTATGTFTNTPASTGTLTASKTSTSTFTNTLSSTPTSSATSSFTSTSTATHSSTSTSSFTSTSSNTPIATLTRTFTSTDTSTPTSTATATSTPTSTDTPTNSATPTMTFTGTLSPTSTSTHTSTVTSTSTWTPTSTSTATFTKTSTPTDSMTPTVSLTATASPSPTPTNTPTVTSSFTATRTPTFTATASFTVTFTVTATNSFTPTSTSSNSPTPTFTASRTLTTTNTPVGNGTPVLFPNPVTIGNTVNLLPPAHSGKETVEVEVFTSNFRRIADETFSSVPPGVSVTLELKDRWGSSLANGLYYVMIIMDGHRSIVKLLVIR